MGYRTVKNVPRATAYTTAKTIHDNIKPIRGKDVRPLGARRDYHQYSVKQNEQGEIEFICYRTPVVTFHPDDTITIRNGGWSSVSTHQFIQEVLGIQANGYKGKTALTIKGNKYLMDSSDDSAFKIKREAEGGLQFESLQERHGYRMNRKAANNVRRRYAPFLDYLKGMLKLREQEIEIRQTSRPTTTTQTKVVISREELDQVRDYYLGNVTEGFRQGAHQYNENIRTQRQLLLELINPDQPEDTRHENFYKAALALARGYSGVTNTPIGGGSILRERQDVLDRTDEALMMAHAEEVLEVTKLEGKAMPNPRYVGWINKEI